MKIREYSLPTGWYPRNPQDVSGEISRFLAGVKNQERVSRAAIAPHAGWYYCGRLAARSVSCLSPDAETVVVIGGHLSSGKKPLFAPEDAVRTPFGSMPVDTELRSILREEPCEDDNYRDNTVEVLLPMVHYFFPDAMLIWLRLPADMSSFNIGKKISRAASKLKRKVNVLASTDLTHYGPNYGFTPKGTGSSALRWVREVNDAILVNAIEEGKSAEVLKLAGRDCSACSVGAVLGAMGFAEAENLGNAKLLEYSTSADIKDSSETPDSFVGYVSMIFS